MVEAKKRDGYGLGFKRARLQAAERLARPDFADRATAAREIGLSEFGLKKIETGERRPSFEMLEAMARAYNVLPGDLLPSSAPRGPEVDRVIAPLAALPQRARMRLIVQFEALARTLATELADAVEEVRAERDSGYGRDMSRMYNSGSNRTADEPHIVAGLGGAVSGSGATDARDGATTVTRHRAPRTKRENR